MTAGQEDPDWFYNEESRVLYAPVPGDRTRRPVATLLDPEFGQRIADAMNATSGRIPPSPDPADPVSEGLAVVVYPHSQFPELGLLACTECGVLMWDVERHWRDAHANRLRALRALLAIRARNGGG